MPVLAELLRQRLEENRAELARVCGVAELAQVILSNTGNNLALEDHPWLRAAYEQLTSAQQVHVHFLSGFDIDPKAPLQVDTVVTVGLGAIPETGTVLVGSRVPEAFRLSLCPRRHYVIVPADKACLTMSEALALTGQEPSGLVSWLTGPSRTADIEKVLVLGAQGAGELIVIVYYEGGIEEKMPIKDREKG
ncbi:Lactate utilization protein B/C [Desulfobacca acetoxidans DSM 11109]|uniref:Lactate utilization protein B/C n=1 Tax=Desulfobacca acetoxidans (strain ATCC 700848 / DSM 11109 / ASRB2) TaxID=880072 RepID=F2NFC1_DESAR|nr:Lactate utilization protein B/C [Desulfobacca acetoxidans DSM 11109]